MQCPIREISRLIWIFRPSGFGQYKDHELESSECIKEKCAWFNKETQKCSVNTEKN